MNLLTAEKITKSYTDRILLQEVDFSIHEGEKIGVIGINGTGKSTLLRLIAQLEVPDQGTISRGTNVKVRYLPQTPEFDKGTTILEAVLKDNVDKINEWTIESEAKTIIHELRLPEYDEKVEYLSGGQKKRVALANALLAPVEILILDEPTNHLDNEMARWLEEYLRKYKGAILMVTHDRYFLDRVSNRIVEIDQGKLYNYPGNYSEFVKLKAQRQNMEIATERKRQSLLRTELEWLHRGARARSTKQKAHIDRIMDMQEQQAPESNENVQMNSVSSRMGRKTIEVQKLCKAYGEKKLIQDYSYLFLKHDRIGIVGENGCGKSTLLKMIYQVLEPDSGTIDIGETIKIGYFSQENEYMNEDLKAIEYIREVGEYIQTTDGMITASQMLERFLFDKTLQWTQINRMSGGEKRRLYLLRILMSAPNVLILDEPTNDLDIQTLTILEDYLDSFDGIVITVSHDRYFLDRIVKRIFAFEGNGQIHQYEGGYSDYLNRIENMGNSAEYANENSEINIKEKKEILRIRDKKVKFSYNEQREFNTIDDDIALLEGKIAALDGKIALCASDYGSLNLHMKEKEEVEAQLEVKMERWVYLNDLQEQITKNR
ncbi:MAG: ABC-F family ATP-binding cassette domain-containing protein [Lachnospiraceae bacterium]